MTPTLLMRTQHSRQHLNKRHPKTISYERVDRSPATFSGTDKNYCTQKGWIFVTAHAVVTVCSRAYGALLSRWQPACHRGGVGGLRLHGGGCSRERIRGMRAMYLTYYIHGQC